MQLDRARGSADDPALRLLRTEGGNARQLRRMRGPHMSNILEMRHYLRIATMKDVNAGVQMAKFNTPQGVQSFCSPVLQYRVKEKVDGKVAWTDWIDVLYVREEMETPNEITA